jgi:hypothetical protein
MELGKRLENSETLQEGDVYILEPSHSKTGRVWSVVDQNHGRTVGELRAGYNASYPGLGDRVQWHRG